MRIFYPPGPSAEDGLIGRDPLQPFHPSTLPLSMFSLTLIEYKTWAYLSKYF